jgi:adenylate cyclase
MVKVIFEHQGTVDKFIGDAIMATWGSLRDSDFRDHACSAVIAMEQRLKELNESWVEQGLEPFHIGTGLHYGPAIVGEIGSTQRTDFTVIGDAVNLASRIEGLTKTLGCSILVSAEILPSTDIKNWLNVGKFQVKGKENAVTLYTPKSDQDLTEFTNGLTFFQQGDMNNALASFQQMSDFSPAHFYINHIKTLAVIPDDWNGVVRMLSK